MHIAMMLNLTAVLYTIPLLVSAVDGHLSQSTKMKNPALRTSLLNFTYEDPLLKAKVTNSGIPGRYAISSPIETVSGYLVHTRTIDGKTHACTPPVNAPKLTPWIALVQRGTCKFWQKIHNTAAMANASAVIVYNSIDSDDLVTMDHYVDQVPSIFIRKKHGEQMAALLHRNITVHVTIELGNITQFIYKTSEDVTATEEPSKDSNPFLIISITLISLLICGLVLLLVFGIQRSHFQHRNKKKRPIYSVQRNGLPSAEEGLLPSTEDFRVTFNSDKDNLQKLPLSNGNSLLSSQ